MKRYARYYITFALIFIIILIPSHSLPISQDINIIAQEYYKLAQACEKEKEPEKAVGYYLQALRVNQDYFDALFKLAGMYYGNHNFTDAIIYYRRAATVRPDCHQACYNLGLCYLQTKAFDDAIVQFKRTIELDPHHERAYLNLGFALEKQNKYEHAIEQYKKAGELQPDLFEAHYHLGNVLKHLERLEEAIEPYQNALRLQPTHTGAIMELANTFNMLEHTEQALALYIKALEVKPNLNAALYNFGFTLKKLGRTHEAIHIYQKVLEQNPDYALAHFGLASACLTIGDFKRGLEEYEWRWQAYNEDPVLFDVPLWDGSNLSGKTIIIYTEQGLGDTLQFIRYTKLIKEQGATIIFQTQRPLKDLIKRCPYIDCIITKNDPAPAADYQIPLMSLPRVFSTRVETIPADIPYLYADPQRVAHWHNQLAHDKNFKLGICWQGNAHYQTQSLRRAVAAKSLPLATLAQLSTINGVSVYSLQHVDGTEQFSELDSRYVVHTFGDDFDKTHGRFMDSAAVIENLDLIISVDTSIAHLAGGLGKPVWLLLPYPTDWRWLTDRTDSPWYPTMRLFQQPKIGDWDAVIRQVVQELTTILDTQNMKQLMPPKKMTIDNPIHAALPDMLQTTLL